MYSILHNKTKSCTKLTWGSLVVNSIPTGIVVNDNGTGGSRGSDMMVAEVEAATQLTPNIVAILSQCCVWLGLIQCYYNVATMLMMSR